MDPKAEVAALRRAQADAQMKYDQCEYGTPGFAECRKKWFDTVLYLKKRADDIERKAN